ncbi:hypothetical protein GCM10010520_18590 [Rhizobium viscosum]
MGTSRIKLGLVRPAKGLITASRDRDPNDRSACIHAIPGADDPSRNRDPNRNSAAAVPTDWAGKSHVGSDDNRGHMHNRLL